MALEMATATEVKNSFGSYLARVIQGDEIVITRNGREVGRIIPPSHVATSLSRSLVGVADNNASLEYAREARLGRQ